MEDKQYGVPIPIIEEFKQISLKRKRDMMPFHSYLETKINGNSGIIGRNIRAHNRVISINPFPYLPNGLESFLLPQQNLVHVDERTVQIILVVGESDIIIIFPNCDAKDNFVRKLGDLNVSPSPSLSSVSSSSSSGSDSSRISTAENFQKEM